MKKIVIIGNGVAGITAARHIRKRTDWSITVISAESDHFYSRPALMYIFMGYMTYEDTKPYEDRFWDENRIKRVRGMVERIDTDSGNVELSTGERIPYDKLLLATGSVNRKAGLPGEELQGVQGFNSLQDIRLLEKTVGSARKAVVVAGGLTGLELVEMIHSRSVPVTCLVRGGSYFHRVLPPEESVMVNRHIRARGVDLRLNTQVKEIVSDGNGHVAGIITDRDEHIECGLLGFAVGVVPNIGMVKQTAVATGRGIRVDRHMRTNIPEVYAAGDCAELSFPDNRIEQLWYTARRQGQVAALNMCGEETAYEPDVFYNSAKFFDIEYQVYGDVNRKFPGEKSVYWEHSRGEKSIRIVYDDEKVLGFNLMGIRYRHEVCEAWLRAAKPLGYVLDHLAEANFDPEFSSRYEKDAAGYMRSRAAGEVR